MAYCSIVSRTAKSEKTNANKQRTAKTGRIIYFISYPYKITLNSTAVDFFRSGIFIARYLISCAEITLSPKLKTIIFNQSSLVPSNLSSFCHNNINPDELTYSIKMNTIFMLCFLLRGTQ